jgi:Leucine-rich repeat (LRR) protein
MPNSLIETYNLKFLNLSQNLFTSTDQLIEMAVNNENLQALDLSFNLLNSIIPQCFSNFQYLEFLDLQMNKFHGTLPSNFSKNIVILNLNGNLLEGLLPKANSSMGECLRL